MIFRRALSGFWDQLNQRPGWSYKIGKWSWLFMQMAIPAMISSVIFSLITIVVTDWSMADSWPFLITSALAFAFSGFDLWDKDRKAVALSREGT